MSLQPIAIDAIDTQNGKYRFGSKPISERLIESVKKHGILNPVKLLNSEGVYTVLTGWKRLTICKEYLPSENIPALVYRNEDTPETERVLIIYTDNAERITELEKAELLSMLKELAGLSDEEMTRNYLKQLGISPGYRNYERYIALSGLDDHIKESFYNQQYTLEHMFLFSDIKPAEERKKIFDRLFMRYRFNINETREILRNITESCSRDGLNATEFLNGILAGGRDTLSKSEIREMISRKRTPGYKDIVERFKNISAGMDLCENVSIRHHPYFETNKLEFLIKAGNKEELAKCVDELVNEMEKGNVDMLLNIIKNGVEYS